MTTMELWEIFKGIGAAVGILVTLITFFGLISKRPKQAFKKLIREENETANKEIKAQILELETKARERFDQIDAKFKFNDETNQDMLRNTITHIYFKYKDTKVIPHYEKENLLYLASRYDALDGNTYIHSIVAEMKTWDETV